MTSPAARRTPPLRHATAVVRALVVTFWASLSVAWPALAAPASLTPRPVVVVGVGGLLASDLGPRTTPALWDLADHSAVGTVVVRSVHLSTCPVDGWLTLGAGSRAAQPGADDGSDCAPLPAVPASGSGQVPGWGTYLSAAAATRQGARLGALAGVARSGGQCVQAIGPGAGLAAADAGGRVARWSAYDASRLPTDLTACPLTLVDVGVLPDAATRSAALTAADARIGEVVRAAGPDATVVVTAVSDSATPRLHPIVIRTHDSRTGTTVGGLRSGSTRQDGLVLLTDLAPTIATELGLPADPSWDGHAVTVVRSDATVADRVRAVVDRGDASRLVTPVAMGFWTTWAVVQMLACALAWLAARRSARAAVRGRRVLTRLLAVTASVPAATFLAALVPWWRSPLPGLTLSALVYALAAGLGTVALLGPWRRSPIGPPAAVAALTALVVGGDAVTGSHLTLSTLLGEQPTIAGRFYGLGNVAFALLATAVLVVMVAVSEAGRRRGRPRRAALLALGLGLLAVVVDGAPWWGADLGGPVALLPAVVLLGLVALGVRLSWTRVAATAAVTVGLVCALAVVDWLRPPGSRSHLGRFVQTALDGGATDVIARKAAQNLHILATAPLAFLVPVGLVLAVWAVARPGAPIGRPLVPSYARVPLLRAGLAAVLLMWLIGFAMNDSGTAIPAVGAALLVPLVVMLALSVRDEP